MSANHSFACFALDPGGCLQLLQRSEQRLVQSRSDLSVRDEAMKGDSSVAVEARRTAMVRLGRSRV
jgi:hypothetical protein